MRKFEKKGFPIILVGENHFEIKRKNDHEFVLFSFSDIREIDYSKGKFSFWKLLFFGSVWSNPSTHSLKITLMNDEKWVYETTEKYDSEFADFIIQLIKRCGLS